MMQQSGVRPILGLDTSTRWASVALVAAGRVMAGLDVCGAMDHSERLLPAVEFLLDRLRLRPRDLGGIAVTVGPGSFTGVRVGLATARGIARAAGLPAIGIGSLEALAYGRPLPRAGAWVCPWLDAGRQEVYAAAYVASSGGLSEHRPPTVARPDRWLDRLPAEAEACFLGDGAEAHRGLLEERRGSGCVDPSGPWFLARTVARLGEEWLAAGNRRPPVPLYVRASAAERARPHRQ